MKCIAVYHVRFEDLGTFEAPIAAHGYQITYRHAGSAPLSEAEWRNTDLVVVLGGPIGTDDASVYPWLNDEVRGLQLRLENRRPTLGICLGAQLMAVALGGQVVRREDARKAAAFEIGWSPLEIRPGAGPLDRLSGVPVLHWHGDNIVLPSGMTPSATTKGTPCQAFQIDSHLLGIQFHAEFAYAELEQWLTGHAVELRYNGVDLQQLRADTDRYGSGLEAAGSAMVRDWLSGMKTSD